MHVSAPHSPTHYLPVQPAAPVPPVKPKAETAEVHPPKPKSAKPAGVGTKLDIHA